MEIILILGKGKVPWLRPVGRGKSSQHHGAITNNFPVKALGYFSSSKRHTFMHPALVKSRDIRQCGRRAGSGPQELIR